MIEIQDREENIVGFTGMIECLFEACEHKFK